MDEWADGCGRREGRPERAEGRRKGGQGGRATDLTNERLEIVVLEKLRENLLGELCRVKDCKALS